jgi:hypothetical protein
MNDKITVHVDPEIKDLVPEYLENRKKDVESMKACVNQGDFEVLQVMGHRFRGGGKLYGFEQITFLGEIIEKAALSKDVDQIQKALISLEEYLSKVEVI